MKIKEDYKVWFYLNLISFILITIGTIIAYVMKKDFDSFNLIILLVLISNMGAFTERKEENEKK